MKRKKMICTALIALNLAFIWGNSLVSGEDSGNLSGGILMWVNSFLGLDEAGAEILHHLIRKAAHFTEFACLGALLAWNCQLRGEKHTALFPALLGMAAAVVDESIQLFTPDRGPRLTDVWIDTSGAVTGMMLLLLGYHLMKKKTYCVTLLEVTTMKKMISMLLALMMVMSLTACGGNNTPATEAPTQAPTEAPTEAAAKVEGTMEELATQIIEKQPVEFMGGFMPVDLTDTSEDGLYAIYSFTGLETAEQISDLAVFEPMMGSIPFSLVMVRTAEGADVAAVAEGMNNGIDQRKWICVEADDLQVVSFGDIVMLIMVGSDTGMTSQSYVDAFAEVCGGEVTVH